MHPDHLRDEPATASPPPTRWALGGSRNTGYAQRFATMIEEGVDVDGEARLADTLCPRGARVLDAGAGMGRVGAALARRGHTVVAAEPDSSLVAQARRTYPDLHLIESDILELDAAALERAGAPTEFDLVIAVGNVMVFLAPDTEVDVLIRLRDLLTDTGRILVGFHLTGGPETSRDYSPEEFIADTQAAGLQVQARFGSYELHPPGDEYAVWVLGR